MLRMLLGLVAMAAVLAVACGGGGATTSPTTPTEALSPPARGWPKGPLCTPGDRPTTGFLVRVAPGTSVAAFTPNVRAPLLAGPSPALEALGFDRLYVARSDEPALLPPDVESVTPLYQAAASPQWHSCMNYHFEDSPGAQALKEKATAYLIAQGDLPASRFADPSTVWMMSDTDFPGGVVAVYALAQDPWPSTWKQVWMTVFDPTGSAIIAAAPANLYAADQP